MGFLENFERQVERLVGGAFAKTFTSGVHPVEIVAALKKELDTSAKVISRSRIVAPHALHLGLAEADFKRFSALGPVFLEEVTTALKNYAATRSYSFSEPLRITLTEDRALVEGIVDVKSDKVGTVVWIPSVTWKDSLYPIVHSHTMIGRGTDCDVQIEARGVSRQHVEIHWDGKKAEVIDLGSTNGTKLDGQKISRAPLPDVCTLTIGQARILFQMVPQAEAAYRSLAQSPAVKTEESS